MKNRQSNIELFRILVTFFVLITHLNKFFGVLIDKNNPDYGMDFKIGQTMIEALVIVGVNGFIILSGWFGLNFKFASLWKLWTVIVGILVPFQIVEVVMGGGILPDGFLE